MNKAQGGQGVPINNLLKRLFVNSTKFYHRLYFGYEQEFLFFLFSSFSEISTIEPGRVIKTCEYAFQISNSDRAVSISGRSVLISSRSTKCLSEFVTLNVRKSGRFNFVSPILHNPTQENKW